ncbi:MAG: Smr/MutS family protein [Polyangiales bacterium]
MGRKRKRKPGHEDAQVAEATTVIPPAPDIGTAMRPLLEHAGLNKVKPTREQRPKTLLPPGPSTPSAIPSLPPSAPPPSLAELARAQRGDRAALHGAYAGVEPIKRPKRGRVAVDRRRTLVPPPRDDAGEQAARARLAALVGSGVRFTIERDEGWVRGLRAGVSDKLLGRLSASGFGPEANLDLHGMRREQAQKAISDFVRAEHRRGARRLLLIVGKGQHSEDGIGVLAETAVDTLSRGLAAPLVSAFASAHERHGGRGAIAVLLD